MTVDVCVSQLFTVKPTVYGGRACFAAKDIPKGTHLLDLCQWTGSSICYEFRKEVCHWCLRYDGKPMHVRIMPRDLDGMVSGEPVCKTAKQYLGSGLWFCSEQCKTEYLQQPHILGLVSDYETILNMFQSMRRQKVNRAEDSDIDQFEDCTVEQMAKIIEEQWADVEQNWMPRTRCQKLTKSVHELPRIDEEHYSCIRFVLETLFHTSHMNESSVKLNAWQSLQSNELEKHTKFPVLLDFQVRVFKWIYVLLPHFREILTPRLLRHILGTEYGNSFGIWEVSEDNESREYLGYMVHPEASYFNHSCLPNVSKRRMGREMQYILQDDVTAGEELCIDYKGILHLDVIKRRQILKDNWFFDCGCPRCTSELQTIHKSVL